MPNVSRRHDMVMEKEPTDFALCRMGPVHDENGMETDNMDSTIQVKNEIAELQAAANKGLAADKGRGVFDWTAICRSLEETFGEPGADGASFGQVRGAAISSVVDKGHIQFECLDECFGSSTLGDIPGIVLPGAFARKPFGNVWRAWKIASIFIRTDLTVAEKIKLHKEGVTSLDAEALRHILRLAYDVCTDWTEFICVNRSISKHPPVEQNCILEFYKVAFENLKEDLREEGRAKRQRKQGPFGYAAPETALLMEKDGPRNGLITKVAVSYVKLRETLLNWRTFGTWILVFPIEDRGDSTVFEDIVKLVKAHLEEGGRVVTAWTPLTAQNLSKWISMSELWKTLDSTFGKFAGPDQMMPTARNMIVDGKVYMEAGCPEATAQFYKAHPGVAAAKHLYEAIRRQVPQAELLELVPDMSMRTSTQRRGGMSEREAHASPPARIPLKRRAV